MIDALKERIKELRENESEENSYRLDEVIKILNLYESHLEQEKEKLSYLYDY